MWIMQPVNVGTEINTRCYKTGRIVLNISVHVIQSKIYKTFHQKQKHYPPLKLHLFSAEEIMAGEKYFILIFEIEYF